MFGYNLNIFLSTVRLFHQNKLDCWKTYKNSLFLDEMPQKKTSTEKSILATMSTIKKTSRAGGSPGLVVKGGCEFESRHWILDGYFSHYFFLKFVFLFEKTENKRKRGRGWTI